MMSGARAPASRPHARVTSAIPGMPGRWAEGPCVRGAGASVSSVMRSIGSERNTGPVGGVSAIVTARPSTPDRLVGAADLVRPLGERLGHLHEVAGQDR